MFRKESVILFQGDSITDCGWNRNIPGSMGNGYPMFVTGQLLYKNPYMGYTFINRGISGNRIVDLYARMKEDILNLKPDVLSILIGVNDVWHEIENGQGVDAVKFKKIYNLLLEEVKEALPDVQFIIMEPFILKTTERRDKWDVWESEMKLRRDIAGELAVKHNAVFVKLQDKLDEASKDAEPSYWARDGVHPTAAGHALIAECWLHAIKA